MKGIKYDADKPRMDLLQWAALRVVAAVLGFGARKYAEHNWRGGMDHSRLFAATMRHLTAYWDGEDNDPESGLSHLAHAACCVLFLLESRIKGYGKDDRYVEPGKPEEKQ